MLYDAPDWRRQLFAFESRSFLNLVFIRLILVLTFTTFLRLRLTISALTADGSWIRARVSGSRDTAYRTVCKELSSLHH